MRFSGRIVASRLVAAALALALLLTSVDAAFGCHQRQDRGAQARCSAGPGEARRPLDPARAAGRGARADRVASWRRPAARSRVTERDLDRAERDLAARPGPARQPRGVDLPQRSHRPCRVLRRRRRLLRPAHPRRALPPHRAPGRRYRLVGPRREASRRAGEVACSNSASPSRPRCVPRPGRKQDQVAEALETQKAYLSSIRADVSRLIAEERERQERIAAERARRLAAALRAQQQAHKARRRPRSTCPSSGGRTRASCSSAMKYLGVPYVWGGSTPDGLRLLGPRAVLLRAAGGPGAANRARPVLRRRRRSPRTASTCSSRATSSSSPTTTIPSRSTTWASTRAAGPTSTRRRPAMSSGSPRSPSVSTAAATTSAPAGPSGPRAPVCDSPFAERRPRRIRRRSRRTYAAPREASASCMDRASDLPVMV